LGLLKKILMKRKDLRLIISSATLDADAFRDFFNLRDEAAKKQKEGDSEEVEGDSKEVEGADTSGRFHDPPDNVKE
jgi:hypothetical protein